MAGRRERCDSGMEEEESVYFNDVAKLNAASSLDQSGESFQGSFTFPTFGIAHSIALQGSHGFQTGSGKVSLNLDQSTDTVLTGTQFQHAGLDPSLDKAVYGSQHAGVGSGINAGMYGQTYPSTRVSPMSVDESGANQTKSEGQSFTALKRQMDLPTGNQFQNLQFMSTNSGLVVTQFGNENIGKNMNVSSASLLQSANNVQGVTAETQGSAESREIFPAVSLETYKGTQEKVASNNRTQEAKMDMECSGENSEVSEQVFSSDEKSQKLKMSPKRRGRKAKASSVSGSESQSGGQDGQPHATSPSRLDTCQSESTAASSDMEFKPPLLDEILAEKKLALMRSPDVMKFLQSQQENFIRDKKISCGQHMDKT